MSSDELVCSRRARQPRTNAPIKPGLLLIRGVARRERAESIRADVARHDQEIALRDVRQKPVLIAERDDPHTPQCTNLSSSAVK